MVNRLRVEEEESRRDQPRVAPERTAESPRYSSRIQRWECWWGREGGRGGTMMVLSSPSNAASGKGSFHPVCLTLSCVSLNCLSLRQSDRQLELLV